MAYSNAKYFYSISESINKKGGEQLFFTYSLCRHPATSRIQQRQEAGCKQKKALEQAKEMSAKALAEKAHTLSHRKAAEALPQRLFTLTLQTILPGLFIQFRSPGQNRNKILERKLWKKGCLQCPEILTTKKQRQSAWQKEGNKNYF